MKRIEILKLLYDYLHGIRPELEEEFGDAEAEDILETAAWYANWQQVASERLYVGCEQYGHAEGASHYRMWSLKDHEDIRVHIWHNPDMLLNVKVVRV